jgi:hypothetical protein
MERAIDGCIDDMEELVDLMFGDAKIVFKGGDGLPRAVSSLSSNLVMMREHIKNTQMLLRSSNKRQRTTQSKDSSASPSIIPSPSTSSDSVTTTTSNSTVASPSFAQDEASSTNNHSLSTTSTYGHATVKDEIFDDVSDDEILEVPSPSRIKDFSTPQDQDQDQEQEQEQDHEQERDQGQDDSRLPTHTQYDSYESAVPSSPSSLPTSPQGYVESPPFTHDTDTVGDITEYESPSNNEPSSPSIEESAYPQQQEEEEENVDDTSPPLLLDVQQDYDDEMNILERSDTVISSQYEEMTNDAEGEAADGEGEEESEGVEEDEVEADSETGNMEENALDNAGDSGEDGI